MKNNEIIYILLLFSHRISLILYVEYYILIFPYYILNNFSLHRVVAA